MTKTEEVHREFWGPDEPVDLVPELAECIVEVTDGVTFVQHPLVHTWYLGPREHYRLNRQLELKKQAVAEDEAKGKFRSIITCWYERPYRTQALLDYLPMMTHREFWETAGHVWIDAENLWQYRDHWNWIFRLNKPEREFFMDEDERKALAKMPDLIEVHRGVSVPRVNHLGSGMSWTLDEDRAKWFAKRWPHQDGHHRRIIHGHVAKENVIAYLSGRNEEEIVCLSRHVKQRHHERV